MKNVSEMSRSEIVNLCREIPQMTKEDLDELIDFISYESRIRIAEKLSSINPMFDRTFNNVEIEVYTRARQLDYFPQNLKFVL